MLSWRDKKPTQKQLDLIAEMQEFSEYHLPIFDGKTRGEAHDWIENNYLFMSNWKLVHESIEHDY